MSKEIKTQEAIYASQTPIEIALRIDENGMTKASNLYSFLELDISHFSRWCNKNIVNNRFAIENEDYFALAIDGERKSSLGFKTKTDYKLTSDFAKKLSMTGNTDKHEQARQYFIACETGLKIATHKLQSQTTIDLKPLTDAITVLTNNMIQIQQDISNLKQSQQRKRLPDNKYPSAWFKRMNPKYKMLMEYFDCTRPVLYSNIYKELEDTYDIDLNELQEEYCYENHLMKEETYPMDVIEHNKQIRDATTILVDSLLIKYGLQTDEELKHFKRKTIFDIEYNDSSKIS